MRREWVLYATEGGARPVIKEREKCRLTETEKGKLLKVLERVERRQTLPGDVKSLGGDLLEVRIDGNRRIFRLVYAEVNGGLLLLALHFFQKTTQATPPQVKRTANRRLADWRKRFPKE
ncbi:type II toxin-antitoxin system RelE/ParE family toxin [Streptomyces sp. NPDC042319]|uniref:type II toxin-antitoxin system RelE/ParE family toxin n=1 Tax=Streptomyces sp. NPDC042319 TaxID=3154332 RepID=UPI0033C1A5BD